MASTIEAIEADIETASAPGFRGRLLARGQARAIIWRDGVLPPNAPGFSPLLSYDLQSYGYSLLGLGLRLRELGGFAHSGFGVTNRPADFHKTRTSSVHALFSEPRGRNIENFRHVAGMQERIDRVRPNRAIHVTSMRLTSMEDLSVHAQFETGDSGRIFVEPVSQLDRDQQIACSPLGVFARTTAISLNRYR